MRAISTRRSPSPRGFPWPVAARSRSGRSFTYRTCRQISARMKKPSSVAAYLRAVPPAPRAALQKLRKTIKAAAPEAIEAISYGIPMFKHHGMLVGYAAFKDHCSLFMSTALTQAHKKALAPYQTSKGTIRFTIEKPLPAALVRKLVKARIGQNEARRGRYPSPPDRPNGGGGCSRAKAIAALQPAPR